jgi:hypothetical protein
MVIQKNLPDVSIGLVRKTLLAALIGLMGGSVAVLAQQANAGTAASPISQSQPADATLIAATVPEASLAPAATTTADSRTTTPAAATIVLPAATANAQADRDDTVAPEAQTSGAAKTPANPPPAKGAKKVKAKKVKPPKLTPLNIVEGTLTLDGWTGKARMNYDIADLKFLYIWAPGVGTVVVSNNPFPQAEMQPNAFSGNTLTLNVKGHSVQIASDKRMLGKKPEPAYVTVDAAYQFASAFPAMGYGATTAAPYAWPGATNVQTAKVGAVVPPPLPVELRPALAPAGCPPTGSKQALTSAPCAMRPSASASASVASAKPLSPTP